MVYLFIVYLSLLVFGNIYNANIFSLFRYSRNVSPIPKCINVNALTTITQLYVCGIMECKDNQNTCNDGNDSKRNSESEDLEVSCTKSDATNQFDEPRRSRDMLVALNSVECGSGEELDLFTLEETTTLTSEVGSSVLRSLYLLPPPHSESTINAANSLEFATNVSKDDHAFECKTNVTPESDLHVMKKGEPFVLDAQVSQIHRSTHSPLTDRPASKLFDNLTSTSLQETDPNYSEPRIHSKPVQNDSGSDEYSFSRCVLFKLPPELLLKIFSYLSLEDVCLRVAPLCRYFYHLSRDPSLWRHVHIYRSCSIKSALMLLNHATQAETLHMANHTLIESILVDSKCVSSCAKTLTCLDIGFSEISVAVLKVTFSTYLPRLLHLNLEGCRFLDIDCLYIIIPRLSKNLKRISFSHCSRLSDDCLNYIFEHLTNLTHLNLDGVEWISDKGVKTIVDVLGSILLALWLDGANLTNVSCELVAQCHRLKLLSIRYCEGFTNILPLRQMSSLRSLSLRKNPEISRDQIEKLFDSETSCLGLLNYLDISECYAIDDDVVGIICSLCGSNLFYLLLEWCWEVTDAGLQIIADSCPHLIRLCLNGMHNIIGNPFVSIPSVFPHLSVLNLANCNNICDELIQKVVDRNPQLIVFSYYGERFETAGAVLPELSTEHDLWRIPVLGQTRICEC